MLWEHAEHWQLQIVRTGSRDLLGDRRLGIAVSRALVTDYLLSRQVHSKGEASLDILKSQRIDLVQAEVADLIRPLCLPIQITDSLYKYQRDGAAWLLTHRRAILADDMGLGKTAQAIRALQRLIRNGRVTWAVVVAPGTLLTNWTDEFARWAPEIITEILAPNVADREKAWRRARNRCHISICSYEQYRVAGAAAEVAQPNLIIADEAHRLRTDASIISVQFRSSRCDAKWLLTGTPIENQAEDLAILMSVLDPDRFSISDAELHESSLRARVRPYLLRRRKDQVLAELPPVQELSETLSLSPEQKTAYNEAIAHAGANKQGFLALFNRLRSICDSDDESGASSKVDRVAELLTAVQAAGDKAVVFSYLLAPLELLANRLTAVRIGFSVLTGEMTLSERGGAVAKFKSDAACTALLASMRVASEGLTLTEASVVIFINRWWNPSANAQARDRVVRIGQTKPVTVYSFTCRGTVEERIPRILENKQDTFDNVVENLASEKLGLLKTV
jgi:SNF2 family DNA or RNA helicase